VVKRKLYPLLASLGIDRSGLHAFRRGNSTLMDRLGVPLKLRIERLAHSDPSLTFGVYTHVASEDDVRFAEQLDEWQSSEEDTRRLEAHEETNSKPEDKQSK